MTPSTLSSRCGRGARWPLWICRKEMPLASRRSLLMTSLSVSRATTSGSVLPALIARVGEVRHSVSSNTSPSASTTALRFLIHLKSQIPRFRTALYQSPKFICEFTFLISKIALFIAMILMSACSCLLAQRCALSGAKAWNPALRDVVADCPAKFGSPNGRFDLQVSSDGALLPFNKVRSGEAPVRWSQA